MEMSVKHLQKNYDYVNGYTSWCDLSHFNSVQLVECAPNMAECDCHDCLRNAMEFGDAAEAQLTWLSE